MVVLRLLAFFALLVAACAPAPADRLPASLVSPTVIARSSNYPVTLTDDRGKTFTFASSPWRVVSLAPSATEIVFALGAGDRLVAVDDFSDYPAGAKALPHLGGFRTSPDKVLAYSPDLIFAISSGTQATQLATLGQPVFLLDPSDLDGVYRNVLALGKIFDREAAARHVVQDMRERIDVVAAKARTAATRPRVLHEVDSTTPSQIFVAGPRNFIDSMITMAGGSNVAADAPVKFPKLSPEEIVARDPEVIILADARYGATPERVTSRPGWGAITAVKRQAIYPIDEDIVSRPGPRLALGFEAYIRVVHPELFP